MVEVSWNLHSSNSSTKNFISSLKALSLDLAQWNSDIFGNIHKNIKNLNIKIDNIHRSGNISSEIDILKNLQVDLGKWYEIKIRSKYGIFSYLGFKQEENQCNSFAREPSGLWISDRDQINSLLINHFSQIGTSQMKNYNMDLADIIHPCVTDSKDIDLTRIPSKEVIWLILSNMNPWGALGPDGFQLGFFKANWNILGPDIISSTQDFFRFGIMEKDFNHSYITLIPKITTPQTPANSY